MRRQGLSPPQGKEFLRVKAQQGTPFEWLGNAEVGSLQITPPRSRSVY